MARLKTEHEVFGALKRRFAPPAYAALPAVRDTTGWAGKRTIDAIIMGCYPSRGLHLHGVEIKTSRSDWLRELRKPEKQESIFRFCDFFWLAVGDKDVAQIDEVPENWGLLVPHGKSMKALVPAPKLEPDPIERGFLASILRRAAQMSVDPEVEAKIRAELRAEYKKDAKQLSDLAEKSTRQENAALKRMIETLKPISDAIGHSRFRQEELLAILARIEKVGASRFICDFQQQTRLARRNVERLLREIDAIGTAFDNFTDQIHVTSSE